MLIHKGLLAYALVRFFHSKNFFRTCPCAALSDLVNCLPFPRLEEPPRGLA